MNSLQIPVHQLALRSPNAQTPFVRIFIGGNRGAIMELKRMPAARTSDLREASLADPRVEMIRKHLAGEAKRPVPSAPVELGATQLRGNRK